MHYIIPDTGDFAEVQEIASRSQIPLLSPQTVREYILQTDGEHTAFVSMKAAELLVLMRHAATLLIDMPSVVMSAPGMIYTADWMSAVAVFPPLDWRTVEKSLAKSGTTAYDPEQAEKREVGAPISLLRSEPGAARRGEFSDESPLTADDIE